jgi:uracil phosphoribosyltransferase
VTPSPHRVVVECNHPLIQHKLTLLRDVRTDTRDFRALCSEVSAMICFEATKALELETTEIETPLERTEGHVVSGKKVGIVPILRAGVGMLDGVLGMIPVAKVGFLGVYRDEKTLQPVSYYKKLPPDLSQREVLLLDPMLATGGSAAYAASVLKEEGARSIRLLSIIAAPEGVELLGREHPDVEIYVGKIDRQLNDVGFIVPGLGDAGDRIWGTR